MRALILILMAGLVGCNSLPKPTEFNEYLVIRIVIDNDLSWMGLDTPERKIDGYADCNNGMCTLYLPDDGRSTEDCIWLHEFKDHAVYGIKHSEDYYAC